MKMGNIWSFLDIIFVGAGVYMLYAWILMIKKGEIKQEVLMSKDIELKKCKDLEDYKAYIAPKMVVFGVSAVIYGGMGLVNSYVTPLPSMLYNVMMFVFLLVLIWFALMARKGTEKFW